jgi:hypothetical protein
MIHACVRNNWPFANTPCGTKHLTVLASSSNSRDRAIAATALGYVSPSDRQIEALSTSSFDPDFETRNNAVRALAVLAEAKPELARQIPAVPFIRLLASGSWPDHNKGAYLIAILSKGRDPRLLSELRLTVLDNLIEMARWKSHGNDALMIIGRIAGIEESRLLDWARNGEKDAIIGALK